MRAKIATKSLRAGPVLAARKREKNIKITSKSPPAGPVFAKTHVFRSFLRVAHPAPYTNAGGKKRKSCARVAARSKIPMGTARRARKKRGWRKKLCFLRAPPGGVNLRGFHRAHEIFSKKHKKNCARRCKKGPVFSNHYSRPRRTFESEQSAFFFVCQRKSVKKTDTRCPAESEKREEKHVKKIASAKELRDY